MKNEMEGIWREVHNEELHNFYYLLNAIRLASPGV
jgi:hypothetical protein